jgi:hypothetical protein
MSHHESLKDLDEKISKAVAHYWKTRSSQRQKQEQTGKADQGLRSAVTGGAQMDGFIDLFSELVTRLVYLSNVFSEKRPFLCLAFLDLPKNGISWLFAIRR